MKAHLPLTSRPSLRATLDGPDAGHNFGMEAHLDRNRFSVRAVVGFGFDSDDGQD
jgi:hypothetical protein